MADISPSVLIVRLDAIGDALALVPLAAALRERTARLAIVLREHNVRIFSSEAFDRVEIASFRLRDDSAENKREIARMGERLAADRYDVVLIATEDPGGYRLARATGARTRIGFENGWGKPIKTLWVRSLCTRSIRRAAGLDARAPHEAEVLFELGRALFGPIDPPRDPAVLRRFVLDRQPHADPRMLLQVTNKWERCGAPLHAVSELARLIARRHEVRFICAQAEAEYAARFTAESNFEVELLADLAPWKEAVAAARALVAPDSGAVQLAGMIGTPAVALFPPEHFALQSARWSPWAAPYRALSLESDWPAAAAQALEELLRDSAAIDTV